MPNPSDTARPQSSYPCARCGATVEFAPGTNALRCPFCGHEQQLASPTRQVREHSYEALMAKPRVAARDMAAQHFVCQSCGARVQGDAVSRRCQFCTAPLVVDSASDAQIAPEAVVPFALDRARARAALGEWVKTRWFAPGRLKNVADAESMRSTYLPHWTFDSGTVSRYTGERGQYYWETETYTETVNGKSETRTRKVRKTRWYPVSGTVSRHFDDVLVAATSHVKTERLENLAPWPLTQAAPFQPGYVAGHESLRYDVEPEEGLNNAKKKMAQVVRDDCLSDIGGDERRVHSINTEYSDITYKLMLLPVWTGSYLYSGKTWQVLINGCSGEVQGDRPYSAAKIASLIAAILALITVVVIVLLMMH